MSTANFTATTNDTLQSCAKVAVTLIDTLRAVGQQSIGRADSRWERLVNRRGARLGDKLRQDLVAAQREITGFYSRGLESFSARSASAVQALLDASVAGVEQVSGRVDKLEAALRPLPLGSAIVIAQPFAEAGREVVGFVAQRTMSAGSRIGTEAAPIDTAAVKRAPAKRKAARRA